MRTLDSGYAVSVEETDTKKWDAILNLFDDANIYQTWSYGRNRWPRSDLCHLVLMRGNTLKAAVQIRLLMVPFLRGIAYIRWGPLWHPKGGEENIEVFRQVIRAIRNEFIEKRAYTVQMIPRDTEDRDDLRLVLEEEGFRRSASDYNTLLIDIRGSEDEIRSKLVARWRTDLNRSQRNGLMLTGGNQIELYDQFAPIYSEMYVRKNLVEFGDLAVYRDVQSDLPADQKMKIMLCTKEGDADCAGAITSAIGDTGLAILWATNHQGRDTKGAYFLQWEVIKWLKQQGCHWYDLGGVNREVNPGGYRFKCGLAGKNGRETRFLGQFQASPTRFHGFLLEAVVRGRNKSRAMRTFIKGLLSKPRFKR